MTDYVIADNRTLEHGVTRNVSEAELNRLDVIGGVLAILITLGPLAATALFN